MKLGRGGGRQNALNAAVIHCNACDKQVPCMKFCHLEQHNGTAKHIANAERFTRTSGKKQQLLTQPSTSKGPDPDQFSMDLCEAFMAADIPFFKLENNKFRGFLEHYCRKTVPNRSTIAKNYMGRAFENCMEKVKEHLADSFCWITVDESVDKAGRAIANLLIGKLDGNSWHAPALISVKQLEKVDSGADRIIRWKILPG